MWYIIKNTTNNLLLLINDRSTLASNQYSAEFKHISNNTTKVVTLYDTAAYTNYAEFVLIEQATDDLPNNKVNLEPGEYAVTLRDVSNNIIKRLLARVEQVSTSIITEYSNNQTFTQYNNQ